MSGRTLHDGQLLPERQVLGDQLKLPCEEPTNQKETRLDQTHFTDPLAWNCLVTSPNAPG